MKTLRTIRNCKDDFKFVCPKLWEQLQTTGDEMVRFCTACKEQVHLCLTDEDTITHAKAGHCIARISPDASELPPMFLGRPVVPIPVTEAQEKAAQLSQREGAITRTLADVKYSHRDCPTCGYPLPDWKVACRVCGEEVGRA